MTTSLIDKIEKLIKREKTTPERKRKDESKSSSEILSELFSAFNADPPKIEDVSVKKSKKSKKKHKKDKKKRSRSSSSSNDSNDSEYSHKRKKRKKSKSKKRRDSIRSPSYPPNFDILKPDPELIKTESIKSEDVKVKKENIKIESKTERKTTRRVSIKYEDPTPPLTPDEAMPVPEFPKDGSFDCSDLRYKLDSKKLDSTSESDKAKGKIQIKNLKFSAVFEETVKKAEEEARKKAEKYEDGEYTDSSNSSVKVELPNFPKSADPGGILKKQAADDTKICDEEKSHSKKSKTESSHRSSRKESSRSHKRSRSRSRRSRSRSTSRRHRRSKSKTYRRSRSRHRSSSRSRRRSTSRTRQRTRHHSPARYRGAGRRSSPSGVKLADSEKKRLLEVARRNAINMLKNGAVPAGAAALPPHTRNQVMAAIQSGGKSVDELTDFCKHLSKKEALGELSSVSSNDDGMSENEDTRAFHHPFLVKEKPPIVMNIRGGVPLPVKSSVLPIANKEELRLQFPVSSGSEHRDTEWVPVSPKKDNMQVARIAPKSTSRPTTCIAEPPKTVPLALPALALPAPPSTTPPPYLMSSTTGSLPSDLNVSSSMLALLAPPPPPPSLPAPGPQAYPPGIDPPRIDMASIVSQKIAMIRLEQELNEVSTTRGLGFSKDLGQFTGSTGVQILTPRELASGTQAWAKKDQLVRAAPVEGGMGMHLLQKMGWTPGQGLGKEGTGSLQPLLLEVKLDTKGLQAKEEITRHGRGSRQSKPQRLARGGRGATPLVAGGKHPVSLLGEYCSKQKLGPPEYNLCFECGPDHKKNFLFRVKVAGTEYQPAVASANKKQAKFDAAQLALQKLGIPIN